jgi:hypothetical protein
MCVGDSAVVIKEKAMKQSIGNRGLVIVPFRHSNQSLTIQRKFVIRVCKPTPNRFSGN